MHRQILLKVNSSMKVHNTVNGYVLYSSLFLFVKFSVICISPHLVFQMLIKVLSPALNSAQRNENNACQTETCSL